MVTSLLNRIHAMGEPMLKGKISSAEFNKEYTYSKYLSCGKQV